MQQRMLEAIRRHFRDYGGSPSHTELAIATGARRNDVGRVLRQLAAAGTIRLAIGVSRGIALPDRADNLSCAELEIAVRKHGGAVTWPTAAAAPLLAAYRVDTDTDCELGMAALLAQIDDRAATEAVDGAGEAEQQDPGQDARADRGGQAQACAGPGSGRGPARSAA